MVRYAAQQSTQTPPPPPFFFNIFIPSLDLPLAYVSGEQEDDHRFLLALIASFSSYHQQDMQNKHSKKTPRARDFER